MKILVFTEGTIIMHSYEGGEESYDSYIPIKNSAAKLKKWQKQSNEVSYITSRKKSEEAQIIRGILTRYDFPKGDFYSRKDGEAYKDVVARACPNVLIEDNCASIGSEEIICSHLDASLKITCIIVPEFGGIDHLPDVL
jgi:hypothetical protein